MLRRVVGGFACCLAAVALQAQTGPAPARSPLPCMTNAHARRFDFWVGHWDVTPAGSSQVVGHSVVDVVSSGCALLENWAAVSGNEGKSLNTYNPDTGQWEQFWVGAGGGQGSYVTDYRESHWDGNTLVYLAHSQGTTGPYLQRLSFTPIDSNTVRQFGELSIDNGTTWTTSYDFYYHRAH